MKSLGAYKLGFLKWWNGNIPSGGQEPESGAKAPAGAVEKARSGTQDISARAIISQVLCGEGNLAPGPSADITELTGRLGLTSEMSMLDLGAGLGGPSRAINHACGIWVTAFEAIPEHAAAGMEQSIMHGMGKKVPVTSFDPETIELPKRKFDCVFSKDMMHHVTDKKRLLAEIQSTLKPNGQFFIINYVITGKASDSPLVAAWNAADGQVSHFWTKEEYVAAFAAAKLELRVTEDQTAQYCAMIAESFRNLVRNMDSLITAEPDLQRQSELRRALAFESARWAVRAEALRAGHIAVTRFSGMNIVKAEIR